MMIDDMDTGLDGLDGSSGPGGVLDSGNNVPGALAGLSPDEMVSSYDDDGSGSAGPASIGDDSWPPDISPADLKRYGFYGGVLDGVDRHQQTYGRPPNDDELLDIGRSMADLHGIPLHEALGLDADEIAPAAPPPVRTASAAGNTATDAVADAAAPVPQATPTGGSDAAPAGGTAAPPPPPAEPTTKAEPTAKTAPTDASGGTAGGGGTDSPPAPAAPAPPTPAAGTNPPGKPFVSRKSTQEILGMAQNGFVATGPDAGSHQCVPLVKAAIPEIGATPQWKKGANISGPNAPPLQPGTAIASGWDKSGNYPNNSTGNHAAIVDKVDPDGTVHVIDQYDHRDANGIGHFQEAQSRALNPGEENGYSIITH
jgi:hypothetical protein